MDTSKFFGKFKDATEDHLQRMNAILLVLEREPDRVEDVKELLREIHTLKGESRMMGFGDMSDVAHAVEDVLKSQEAQGFRGLSEVSDGLFEGFDRIQSLLDAKAGGEGGEQDVEEDCAKLKALAGGAGPAPPVPPAAPPTGSSDETGFGDLGGLDLGDLDLGGVELPGRSGGEGEALREAFGVPEGVPTELEGGALPPPPASAVSIGGGVAKFLGKFGDATRDHLQRMNAILLQLESNPDRPSEVTELLREIHTLKGESRMMGFGDMSDLAHAIEDLLKAQQDEGFRGLSDVTDTIFGAFDAEEALLAGKLGEPAKAVDVPALVAELGALAAGGPPTRPKAAAGAPAPGPPAPGPPAPPGAPAAGAQRPQLDPSTAKFMGKFADATADHLERMNALVLQLESDPDRPEEVRELMREIHTLKGEARMMGLGDMSDLAHATESLLKHLEASGFRTLAEQSDLIFEAFDAQSRLLQLALGAEELSVDPFALGDRLRAASGAPVVERAATPAAPSPPPPAPAERSASPPAPRLEAPEALLAESFIASLLSQVEELRSPARGAEADRSFERALKGLEGEARMAGFPELLPLLAALPEARAAGRAAPLEAAVDALLPAAEARRKGEDPSEGLRPHLEALAGRTAPAPPPQPEEAAASPGTQEPSPAASTAPNGSPNGSPAAAQAAEPPAPAGAQSGPTGAGPAPPRAAAGPAPKVNQTIRISLSKLEELGNLTGDIYLNHSRSVDRQRFLRELLDVAARQARSAAALRQVLSREGSEARESGQELAEAVEGVVETQRSLRRQLQDMLHADRDEYLHSGHQIVDLRERVRALQMLPVSTLFDMYPRMVRDLAKEMGKKVRLVIQGAETELDRRVLDEIRDPMVHLIRNSIDHGIESPRQREAAGKPAQGTVRLAARAEGDHVVIEIEDDGAGIDPARIRAAAISKGVLSASDAAELSEEQAMQLIFAPGFSSKEEVSDLSGRGVGMDVVRQKVESLEGRIGPYSEVGQGTRMALRLPLTLAMARVLLLRAGGLLLAVPATFVAEVSSVPESAVRRVEAYEAVEWHGKTIPIVSMANVLEREARPLSKEERLLLVLGFEEHVVGFVVDAFEGEREVVVKRLDAFLGRVRNVAGATILSSGAIVVVLHVPQLIASTMGVSPLSLRARLRESAPEEAAARAGHRLLVVDDSIIVRDMMKGVLESAGFDVTLAVDGMDGLEKQLAGAHDLIITDVEMPRMDGFEFTRSIKQNERHADVPIIIVTTLDSPESKAKGLQAGASAYVVKNLLGMSQLVETIRRLVS